MDMKYQYRITLPEGGGRQLQAGLEGLIGDSIDLGALAWVSDYETALSSIRGDFLTFSGGSIKVVMRALFDLSGNTEFRASRDLPSAAIVAAWRSGDGRAGNQLSATRKRITSNLRAVFPFGGRFAPFKIRLRKVNS